MLLALEWDSREVRLAVGQAAGSRVRVEQAFTLPLPADESSGPAADKKLGEQIAAIIAQHGIATSETLVAVGRASIELRPMSLPPAPDAELPDMVRMQAPRQFTTIGENWPVDFSTITSDPAQPRDVLAATIAPTLVAQIEQICAAAGLAPRRLVLRPFAAASLLARAAPKASQVRLLVDLLVEEADLTALVGDTVHYIRTVRLPGPAHSADQNRAISGEIRRTIVAVQHERGGNKVEAVVICGDREEHSALREQLERDLRMPVELFDPFSAVELSGALRAKHPDQPGRFAPLLGMLRDEAAETPHAIDFLNPRQKPEPPSQSRFYTLVAAAAAVLLLAFAGLLWWDLDSKESRLAGLIAQNKKLKAEEKPADREMKKAERLEKWVATDVSWIDVLADLSADKAMPPPEQLRLTKLELYSRPDGGGEALLDGVARSSQDVRQVETILKDGKHRVRAGGSKEGGSFAGYPWDFRQAVQVLSEEEIAVEEAARKKAAGAAGGAAAKKPAAKAGGAP